MDCWSALTSSFRSRSDVICWSERRVADGSSWSRNTMRWWEDQIQWAIKTQGKGLHGQESNKSVDTANLLLIDYDRDPFLVPRFWFWECECVDSPGKEIIVLCWKMEPACVCVRACVLTSVTCLSMGLNSIWRFFLFSSVFLCHEGISQHTPWSFLKAEFPLLKSLFRIHPGSKLCSYLPPSSPLFCLLFGKSDKALEFESGF